MANNEKLVDFSFEKELKQRMHRDAQAFDAPLSARARDNLLQQLDGIERQHKPVPSKHRSHSPWLGLSLAASVGLAVLTLTLPNQHSPIESAADSPTSLNNLIAAHRPATTIKPLPQEQALSQEYQAILSDIEKLGARLGVN